MKYVNTIKYYRLLPNSRQKEHLNNEAVIYFSSLTALLSLYHKLQRPRAILQTVPPLVSSLSARIIIYFCSSVRSKECNEAFLAIGAVCPSMDCLPREGYCRPPRPHSTLTREKRNGEGVGGRTAGAEMMDGVDEKRKTDR